MKNYEIFFRFVRKNLNQFYFNPPVFHLMKNVEEDNGEPKSSNFCRWPAAEPHIPKLIKSGASGKRE
jgi:sulfur relay (sulfurtransferase) DsrC/TusE family protein